ncbi:hypothetical protein GLOIN_2v1488880 [Rhizophagus clarus]|nr:hypothetical protein GLOIN_2v1488880 [Rhizophagus clarus]
MAEKYKKGTRDKRSLVEEQIYEEFSSKFWLKPKSQSGQARNRSVKRFLSRTSSSSCSSNTRTSDIMNLFETSPLPSRPVTPSVEASVVSRPITSTLPSFSQNANIINITINYGKGSDEQ